MLNTTFKIGATTNQVTLNTPSTGIIQKSHPKSRFIRFHVNSDLAKTIIGWKEQPHYTIEKGNSWNKTEERIDVTVLQIMVFGKDDLLVEIVHNVDLENNIKNE